jgi:beta-lactamase class D
MRKILKILLILQILVQTAFATDTAWYSSSQNEFTITTPEQLAGFAKLVNEGNSFEGKNIKLGKNISLNDTANWTPIGKFISAQKTHWFMGTLDGNGFVISGININNSAQNQGLFERIG